MTVNRGVSAITTSSIDNTAKHPAKLSDNIATGFLTSRDGKIEFDIIRDGIPTTSQTGKTLIVFITGRAKQCRQEVGNVCFGDTPECWVQAFDDSIAREGNVYIISSMSPISGGKRTWTGLLGITLGS